MTPALKSLGEIPADCELLAVVETREQAPLAVLTKSIAVLPALDQLMIKSVRNGKRRLRSCIFLLFAGFSLPLQTVWVVVDM